MYGIIKQKRLDETKKCYLIEKDTKFFILIPVCENGKNVFQYTLENDKYYVRGELHIFDKNEVVDVEGTVKSYAALVKRSSIQYVRKNEKWCL